MQQYPRLLLQSSICVFSSTSLLYWILLTLSGKTCIFSTFQGSSSYHCMFPYQYIGVFSLSLGLLLPVWILYFLKTSRWKKYVYLLLTGVGIFILSCILGGILWATHEVFVVGSHRGMGWPFFYLFEIKNTFIYAWIILLRTFPYNILSLSLLLLGILVFEKKHPRSM